MSASPDDIDALAGEYVLGTLDPAERASVAARRLREPVLDGAIREWEQRLSPLDALVAPVAPPSDLLAKVETRVFAADAPPAVVHELETLRRRLSGWRRAAIVASAAAASLLGVVVVREALHRELPPQNFVAVFQKDDVLPTFYLTIDLKSRVLTLRPVDARKQPGRTYQLWIASDQLGPAPQSLGLVDDDLAPTRKTLASFDPALLRDATFGVSLEPTGGSPTGRPTGPALHARLLPVAN